MKRLICIGVIAVCTVVFTGIESGLEAKKIKFQHSFNKAGAPKVLAHFVSGENQANTARPLNEFCMGRTVHFYYKIGPVQTVKGKGMPYRTRMVIDVSYPEMRGEKINIRKGKKDFGWKDANGVKGDMMNKSQTFGYYHTAGWNLNLASNLGPSVDYTVTIYHNDLNSGKTLKMEYKFQSKTCQ